MSIAERVNNIKPSFTLQMATKAAEMRSRGIDVINFSVGEPDFNTPNHIRDAAKNALDQGYTKYTAGPGMIEFREAICTKLYRENGILYEPSEILVSNGEKQSLYNACQAILNPEDQVIVFAPYWVSFPEFVKMADAKPVLVNTLPENNFEPDFSDLESKINPKIKGVIINSPSNPTWEVLINDAKIYFGKGAISKSVLRTAEQTYQSSLQNLLSIQNQAFTAKGNVINAKSNLDKAISDEERKSTIKAPYDGKVLQIFRNIDSKTEVNGTLMQISRANSDTLSVLAYFTAKDAASLKVGQSVRMLPNNVKANTVGQLKGTVNEISAIPISQTEASSILGSNVMADDLTSNNKNIQVKIDLIKTDDNPTGYEWINGCGPNEKSTNQFPRIGIMGNVSVITGSIPPITLGLPALKKFFGIE